MMTSLKRQLTFLIIFSSFICCELAIRDYNYLVFENFALNEQIHKQELLATRQLRNLRNELHNLHTIMPSNFRDSELSSISLIQKLKRILSDTKKELESLRPIFLDVSNKIGDPLANYIGAMKGLMMLEDTFKLDILKMAEGIVTFKGEVFHSQSTLNADDFVQIGSVSSNDGWYDSSIRFFKAARILIKEKNDTSTNIQIFNDLKAKIIKVHNNMLIRKKQRVGPDYKLLPYVVNSDLERKKKQPKCLEGVEILNRHSNDSDIYESGDKKEDAFRMVCRGELKGNFSDEYTQPRQPQCHLLHQNNPYLVLGPFKLEVKLIRPFRSIFHDFLTDSEMKWILEYSKPRLSTNRLTTKSNSEGEKYEFRQGKRVRVVHKTVQVWFNDVLYNEETKVDYLTKEMIPLRDPDGFQIFAPIIHKLSRKIEIATKTNITSRLASTFYQTTNYGLGGLCETHMDPHGYLDNVHVSEEQSSLFLSGDMMATFMAWLDDVPAGGETGFDFPNYEMVVEPKRGSAAFWMNLKASGARERSASHGGCPVLIGSKWILNKWVYVFDQWKEYPCHLNKTYPIKNFDAYYKNIF